MDPGWLAAQASWERWRVSIMKMRFQSFIHSIMVTGYLLRVVVCPVAGDCGREGNDPRGARGLVPRTCARVTQCAKGSLQMY